MSVERRVGKHRVQPCRRFDLITRGYLALFGNFGPPLTPTQRTHLARWVRARRKMGRRRLLDYSYAYVPSVETDVRATFERVRRRDDTAGQIAAYHYAFGQTVIKHERDANGVTATFVPLREFFK